MRTTTFLVSTVGLLSVSFVACSSDSTPADSGTSAGPVGTGGAGGSGAGGGAGGLGPTGGSGGTTGGAAGTASPAGGAGGNGGSIGAQAIARFHLPTSGVPSIFDVPWPSDVYREADGTLVDTIPGFANDTATTPFVRANGSFVLDGLGRMNGFGVNGGAMFKIDDPATIDDHTGLPVGLRIDKTTLPADEAASIAPGAAAMLLDLDATSPATARVAARVAIFDPTKSSSTPPLLVIQPARGLVLAESHHYAAVLTSGLTTDVGVPVTASDELIAIRDHAARATDAQKLYGDALDKAVSLAPELAGKIVAIAPYTTFHMSDELFDMRSQIQAHGPPQLSWKASDVSPMTPAVFVSGSDAKGFTATLDSWLGTPDKTPDGTRDDPATDQPNGRAHGKLAVVGTAVFDAMSFLQKSPMGYADVKFNTVYHDASGHPAPPPTDPTSKIWVTIALPQGPMPPAGFPVVVVQHGLGGDRLNLLEVADTFAQKGWASVAIEAVTHGARAASNPALTVDAVALPSRQGTKDGNGNVGTKWGPAGLYDGPDGFVDKPNGSTDFFATLLGIPAIRDQLRQSALDIGSTFELLANPALDLGPLATKVPGAKLDPSRMAYIGNSLGGIIGALVAASEPLAKTFVLNVPGGGLITELGTHAPVIGENLGTAVSLNFGFKNDAPVQPTHPLAQMIQHVVDGGDPLTFARSIVTSPGMVGGKVNPAKNILQVEVLWDELVANESNEALARAGGWGLGDPSTGSIANVPLMSVAQTSGHLADTPFPGVTAVMVQASPATHGANMSDRFGTRTYAHPYGQFDKTGSHVFPTLPAPIQIKEPYLETQAAFVSFLDDAFQGMVPRVQGFVPPVRDFDGDGVPDASDSSPEDPSSH